MRSARLDEGLRAARHSLRPASAVSVSRPRPSSPCPTPDPTADRASFLPLSSISCTNPGLEARPVPAVTAKKREGPPPPASPSRYAANLADSRSGSGEN